VGDYAIQIEGLFTARTFRIGPVTIYRSISELPFHKEVSWDRPFESTFVPTDDQERAIACIKAGSRDDAILGIQQALAVLRVFQFGEATFANYFHFGLQGEISRKSINYLVHNEGKASAGFVRSGLHLGYQLTNESIERWECESRALQFAAEAIGDLNPSEGAKLALAGIEYFSRSILTTEPELRVLLIIAGLESMLTEDSKSPQSFDLARYLTFFSCWKIGECSKLNGEPCAYLIFDPNKDLVLLKQLKALAEVDPAWRCSEWLNFHEWYDRRSGFVHGNPYSADVDEVINIDYWAYHQYAVPILEWLVGHKESPMADLKAEVNALEAREIDWRLIVKEKDLEIINRVLKTRTPRL